MSNEHSSRLTRRKALAALGAASLGLAGSVFASEHMLFGETAAAAEVVPDPSSSVIATIEQMRSTVLPNPASAYFITDPGREGLFFFDPRDKSSPDDDGTILVASNGARYKRVIENDVFNVKWFGAKANGNFDDTSAIQRTLDAVNRQGGGVIFLPSGNYVLTTALMFHSYSHIIGAGKVSTNVINKGSDFAFKPSDVTKVTRHASIESLRISGGSGNAGGILIQNCNQCVFDNIEMGQVPGIGMYVYGTIGGCYWNNIVQCHFGGQPLTTHAIKFDRSAKSYEPNANKVHQCVISGGGMGIEIVAGDTLVISETGVSDTTGPWVKNGGQYNRFIANRYENGSTSGGGFIHTSTSVNCVMIADTIAGGNESTRYVDSGSGNSRINNYNMGLAVTSVDRLSITPKNNTNDSIEFLPHPTFGGDIIRVFTDSNKLTKTFAVDKMGNVTSRGSLDMSGGGFLRLPNTANVPASPVKGTIYFDSRSNKLKVWTGAKWETVTSS
ncbi:MAG: hypothetical protein K0R28_109 [Paenibacillus sp.]|nr:hypothetical protein [Paenibacillus sp.]